jgi:MOSC domain-containing protein YiiM
MPQLQSIQVSLPRVFGSPESGDPATRTWVTGFFKQLVTGPVTVTRTHIVGDGQADLVNHGGPDKAVLAYSAEHYPGWRTELGLPGMPHGAFGENLTITGLKESDVCVGDVWRAGEIVFEVSQPRQPCWKLARRWNIKDLPARVIAMGRSGWYLRVVHEGTLSVGTEFVLEQRPNPDWTIARANEVMYHRKDDAELSRELAYVRELSMSWREALIQRAAS